MMFHSTDFRPHAALEAGDPAASALSSIDRHLMGHRKISVGRVLLIAAMGAVAWIPLVALVLAFIR